jgi:hypothetical protein
MKPMPIKGTPYKHQQAAFEFALGLMGLTEGGGDHISISGRSAALLMEM